MKKKAIEIFGTYEGFERVIGFNDYCQVHLLFGSTVNKNDLEKMNCDFSIGTNYVQDKAMIIIEFFSDDFTE